MFDKAEAAESLGWMREWESVTTAASDRTSLFGHDLSPVFDFASTKALQAQVLLHSSTLS